MTTPLELVDFDDFCRREHPRLVRTLTLVVGDQQVAEELTQEALVRADRHWGRVRGLDAPGAWLLHVAMNLGRSHLRRRSAARRAQRRIGGQDLVQRPEPVAEVLAVREAVASLPRAQREVIVLRWFLDLDVAGTAAALGTSEASVRSHAHRAMQALRSHHGLLTEESADVR